MVTISAELKKGICLMIFSSMLSCFGQLLWKLFALQNDYYCVIAGFMLYGIGALSMIIAYRFGKLSILQPILSLNYVFSLLLAIAILNEKITLFKGIGVFLIIFGLINITKDANT